MSRKAANQGETPMEEGQAPIIGNVRESDRQVLSSNMPSDAVCTVSFAEFKSYMTKEITGMKATICKDIGASIERVSEKVMVNAVTIAEVEKKVDNIGKAVAPEVMRKEMKSIAEEVIREAPHGARGSGRICSESDIDDERKYWWSRRCLRLSPVADGADGSLWESLGKFIYDELLVPEGDVPQSSVESVRRVRNSRRTKVVDEVLVVFKDVQTRDEVARNAVNLAAWDGKEPRPSLRMEIPQHLICLLYTSPSPRD